MTEKNDKTKAQADGTYYEDNDASSVVNDADFSFAKERFKLHQTTPEEGVSIQALQNYILKKYGI